MTGPTPASESGPVEEFERWREDMRESARRGKFGPVFQRWFTAGANSPSDRRCCCGRGAER